MKGGKNMKENITTNNDLKNKSLDKGLNKKTKTSARKVKKKLGMGLSSLCLLYTSDAADEP